MVEETYTEAFYSINLKRSHMGNKSTRTTFKCTTNQVFHVNGLQELQRDIERHSTGVASVLNLCEVLLHDCDACSTENVCDFIQQTIRGLEKRWRNICAMSMERRLKSVYLAEFILIDYIHLHAGMINSYTVFTYTVSLLTNLCLI